MPEGLKIQVEAEVQQAVKALGTDIPNAADATASSIAGLASSTRSSFSSFEKSTTSAGEAFKKTAKQVSIFEGSLETLQARLGARKSFLNTETDVTKIAQLNKEISYLEATIAHTSNIGKVQFDKLGNTISTTSSAAKNASANINLTGISFANLGNSATKALSALRTISYVLPGIGLAGVIGLITQVGGALIGLGTDAKETAVDFSYFDAKIKAAAEAQKKLSEEIDKAAASVLKQASTLGDLKNALISVTSDVKNLTAATIQQGVAQFLFDKKNAAVQELLAANIEDQIRLRKQLAPLSQLKSFTIEGSSKDPLIRRIADAKDGLRQINELSFGLEDVFKKLFAEQFPTDKVKVKTKKLEVRPELGSFALELPTVFDVEPNSRFSNQLNNLEDRINKEFDRTKLVITPKISIKLNKITEAQQLGIDTAKSFNEGLVTGLSDATSGFAEGIGRALSGGGIGDAFKAFATGIGDALQAMGKQIIAIGLAAVLAKEALASLFKNPFLAVAAGVALVAVGAALKNALAGGVKGFASGGLVTGPQLALIGEGSGTSRSNPEVVAPLDKLKGMIAGLGGGGASHVYVTGRLRGNDMILQNSRTSRAQRRAGVR